MQETLLKITPIFTIRWVASSFRAVKAVWHDFAALGQHFHAASEDKSRSSKERSKYNGDHTNLNVAQWFHAVPKFRENAVEDFFVSFEKMAHRLKWPYEYWSTLLQHVLVGKALEVYNQLHVEGSDKFENVKEAILNADEKVPEEYRQKFRSQRKTLSQTYVEFAHIKQRSFDQWCHAMNVQKDYENLRQIVLIEEFKNNLNVNLRMYIDERRPKDINEAGWLEEYTLIHQTNFQSKQGSNSHRVGEKTNYPIKSPVEKGKENQSKSSSSKPQSSNWSSSVRCSFCKKRGHVVSDCFILKRRQEQQSFETQKSGTVGHISTHNSTPNRFTVSNDDTVTVVKDVEKPLIDFSMESFKPFSSMMVLFHCQVIFQILHQLKY